MSKLQDVKVLDCMNMRVILESDGVRFFPWDTRVSCAWITREEALALAHAIIAEQQGKP